MSTTVTTQPQPGRVHTIVARLARRHPVTRRDLQVALGVLWLLDGVLQAQPFMFTHGFATQLIAGAGQGQPGFVSGPVHLGSVVVAADPVLWNVLFAGIQILLGIGLFVRRTARFALAASIGWALGVWYLGEGLSGMASGHASLLTGAPGSALLYAVLGAAAWPRGGTSDHAPASWLVPAWAVLWIGGAILQLLPGQNTGPGLASVLTSSASVAPHWLARIDTSVAAWASRNGALAVTALAAIPFLVGVGALYRRTRTWARHDRARAEPRDVGHRARPRPALQRPGNRSEQRAADRLDGGRATHAAQKRQHRWPHGHCVARSTREIHLGVHSKPSVRSRAHPCPRPVPRGACLQWDRDTMPSSLRQA